MGHTIATIFLPRSYCQTYSGYPRVGFCLSTGQCTGASSTRHHRFPGAKDAKLHRSTIANVSELDMRLVNERGCIVQSIVDTVISQWRRRLNACVRGAGHTLSTKHD